MKTFRPETVLEAITLKTSRSSIILVRVRGRGWFMDERHTVAGPLPKAKAIWQCLTTLESNFEKVEVQRLRLRATKRSRPA